MSIDTALSTAVSSLRVNQENIALIAENIANANSENYTRRVATQKSEIVDGEVAGVKIAAIKRSVDEFLVSAARGQIAEVGRADTLSQYFNKIQDYFGQPGASNSLNTAVDNFFGGLSDLAGGVDQTTRNRALQLAEKLSSKISGLARNLENVRFEIDQEIKNTVDNINDLLTKLNNINKALREVSANKGDNTALLDERDGLVSEISKLIDVNVSYSGTGEVTLTLNRGDILNITQKFRLDYTPAPNVETLINGDTLGAISVILLDQDGNDTNSKFDIYSASNATTKEIGFSSGKLKGLLDLRDSDLPKILAQLDEFAESFKDSFNAIHNDGAGFPPPEELAGTRLVTAASEYYFSGSARIAILKPDGTPVLDPFDSIKGYPSLTIDFDKLDGGNGQGIVTVQSIINEINNYYGPPPSQKVSLHKLDDIRIAAVSDSITTVEASGTIAFNGNPGVGDRVVINGITYTFVANGTASSGTNIELKSTAAATVTEVARYLNTVTGSPVSSASYSASGSTLTVTHKTGGTAGNSFTLSVDFSISGLGATASINGGAFGATPSGTLQNGANASGTFEFDFEFSNISDESLQFEVLGVSIDGGATGFTGTLPDDFDAFTASAGERVRTGTDGIDNDTISVDLTGSTKGEGGAHQITVQMRVTDGDGNTYTDTVVFNLIVPDPNENIINKRYTVVSATGSTAVLTSAVTNQRFATAMLVDEDGNEITDGSEGYLLIRTDTGDYGIAIDEIDSKEEGEFSNPTNTKTERGFSHFFGLNDFFESGDVLKNSAVNFAIREDYKSSAGRLAAGELTLSVQPSDPDDDPIYTYGIGVGSDQLAKRLAALAQSRITFDSAGGVASLTTTLSGYTGEVTSYAASQATAADESKRQAGLLFNAFNDKLKASGGVNIDEELANTIQFQTNYSASARMINVISDLFQKLIDAF